MPRIRRPRLPETARLPMEFRAYKDHVVGIIWIDESSIGLRFESPEHIMNFMVELMEKAKLVWPDHPIIKEYVED